MYSGRIPSRSIASALALVLCGLAQGAAAQATASDIETGRQLFMSNGCYTCHGTVGQGSVRSGGPRLAPEPYPFEAFKAMVRNPRESMPRFDPRFLSDEQLLAIHSYLAAVPKGPSAKDIPQLSTLAR
jgi:ubiquinol-cytochrome c reductase cytochrome c subunit